MKLLGPLFRFFLCCALVSIDCFPNHSLR